MKIVKIIIICMEIMENNHHMYEKSWNHEIMKIIIICMKNHGNNHHITWKVLGFLRLFTTNGQNKLPRQECSKTIGKTCISASAKNPGALEILRLGGNPYKTLGKRWFHATETGTWIEPLVCSKDITLGAPCGNIGIPWFSWRPPLPYHCGTRCDLGGCCKILWLTANPYKTNRESMIPHQRKMQGIPIGTALNVG